MEIIGAQQGLAHAAKVSLVKTKLGVLFRAPRRHYRLNTGEPVETGLSYTDRAVDAGELLYAMGRCTPRQQEALRLWLGREGLSQRRIAERLGVNITTVKRDLRAALETMVTSIWDD